MKARYYREIWSVRFNKMLELEKNAVIEYEKLLEECRRSYKGHAIEGHLERILRDEGKHVKMVEELIRILDTHAEIPV